MPPNVRLTNVEVTSDPPQSAYTFTIEGDLLHDINDPVRSSQISRQISDRIERLTQERDRAIAETSNRNSRIIDYEWEPVPYTPSGYNTYTGATYNPHQSRYADDLEKLIQSRLMPKIIKDKELSTDTTFTYKELISATTEFIAEIKGETRE